MLIFVNNDINDHD